jgi:methylthioribose-1-phosphate isomerase
MNVGGVRYRTIWATDDGAGSVRVIDQRELPFEFVVAKLETADDAARAIADMTVRGAGLIGATAGWGMALAARGAATEGLTGLEAALAAAAARLVAARPTAVNLAWAVARVRAAMDAAQTVAEKVEAARREAAAIADEDAEFCRRIGEHGLPLLEALHSRKGGAPVNVLTHCNAGWLAFVDWGSATAPIYAAHDAGIPVHVWVDETRPWNQGARLTAWELGQHGVPHTVIADNAGGHLMQHGLVDVVITGTDRTTVTGDVANKIGTYLKALAARDNGVPFYVALPSSTFDWSLTDGVAQIPIETRDGDEVHTARGRLGDRTVAVRLTPLGSPAANYAFDVTPARLVTGLITERGVCPASREGVLGLYPEKRGATG